MERYSQLDNSALNVRNISTKTSTVTVDVNKVPNAVLRRLIAEVKVENQNNISAYNRTHNRHNRGR